MTEDIKYLGVDWGQAKIGLALGQASTKMATPFKVVSTLAEVLQVIRDEEIDVVVLGQPLSLAGQADKISPDFLAFQQTLQTQAPVELIDERLTSHLADNLIKGQKNTAQQDAIAAMLILQTYLNQKA